MKNQNKIQHSGLAEFTWELNKGESRMDEGNFLVDECVELIENKVAKLNRHAPVYDLDDLDEEDDSN